MGTTTSFADDPKGRISIDFIDPLFAVVLNVSFAQIMNEDWFRHFARIQAYCFEVSALFLVGYVTVVLSWVGYHRSIRSSPIVVDSRAGFARFILDIVLLVFYFVLIVSYGSLGRMLYTLAAIFVVYVSWDWYKRQEYPEKDNPLRRGVTVCWALYYCGLAALFAFWPRFASMRWAVLAFAVIGNFAYRFHKEHLWPKPVLRLFGVI